MYKMNYQIFKSSLTLFIFSLFVANVFGRNNGAPKESCLNLKPNHGNNLQPQPESTNPFRFNITMFPYLNDEEFIQVEINSNNERIKFGGFIVQARLANNLDVIADGTFIPIDSNQTRAFQCDMNKDEMKFEGNNTWTHSNSMPKKSVSAFWFPAESSMNNEIVFMATVAIDMKTYWHKMVSDKIPLIENDENESTDGQPAEDEIAEEGGQNEDADNNGNDNVDFDDNESTENKEQYKSEPSNNVESIISGAFTINNNWKSILSIFIISNMLLFFSI